MHERTHNLGRRVLGAIAVMIMTVISSPYIPAQEHVTTDASFAAVTSTSYTGTIVVGAALVGRIDASRMHGWWSLRIPPAVVSSVAEVATPGLHPINGVVSVTAEDDAQVSVRDITGKLIDAQITNTGTRATIDLSGVNSGVYFVQVVVGDRVDRYRVLNAD